MRADAKRNRQHIVAAARYLFETRGSSVPMSAVARRAGVSIATLYRRFPDRQSLILEVVTEQVRLFLHCVDAAIAEPDPRRSLFRVLENLCETQLRLRNLIPELLEDPSFAPTIKDMQQRANQALSVVVGRALEAGILYDDFSRDDLTVMLLASINIHSGSLEADVAAARRLVYLLHRSVTVPVQADSLVVAVG
jgi:AcrR family transcriptional regulator